MVFLLLRGYTWSAEKIGERKEAYAHLSSDDLMSPLKGSSIPTKRTRRVKTVHSYNDLKTFLEELGPPKTGKVRVFRGQTRAHVDALTGEMSLLPNLLRSGLKQDYDAQWFLSLLSGMIGQVGELPKVLGAQQVVIPALIQHYGPGSAFLDVTFNPDIALWFGLHHFRMRWLRVAPDPSVAFPAAHHFPTAWYQRLNPPWPLDGGCPVIYVFDVDRWDGKLPLSHGCLVDLAKVDSTLPEVARRIHVQAAALLYADHDLWSPDLGYMTTATISLDRDFSADGCPAWSTKEIFPPPENDPFYETLLGLPYRLVFDPMRMEHPLKIPWYLISEQPIWESEVIRIVDGDGTEQNPSSISSNIALSDENGAHQELIRYTRSATHLMPPILYMDMLGPLKKISEPVGGHNIGGKCFRLDDALRFLMEAPMWSLGPDVACSGERGFWLESALPIGIAENIFDRQTDNVYIELSALDVVPGFARFEGAALRAIWVVTSHYEYVVSLYFQTPKKMRSALWRTDLHFQYSLAEGRFSLISHSANGEDIRRFGLKALFLTLTLLRDLSPGFKPPAIYSIGFSEPGEEGRILYRSDRLFLPQLAAGTELRLERHESPSTLASFFLPKSLDGTPYSHQTPLFENMQWGPEEFDEGLRALDSFFPLIRDPHYVSFVGLFLAKRYVALGRIESARSVLERAIAAARSVYDGDLEVELLKEKVALDLGN